jgi:CheY-like chemotaxis protein
VAHILLAEDEVLIALMFQDALEVEGHRVSIAHDGIEALEVDEQDPAEVLVTDLAMPRMGGRELLERLRAPPPRPSGAGGVGISGRIRDRDRNDRPPAQTRQSQGADPAADPASGGSRYGEGVLIRQAVPRAVHHRETEQP